MIKTILFRNVENFNHAYICNEMHEMSNKSFLMHSKQNNLRGFSVMRQNIYFGLK